MKPGTFLHITVDLIAGSTFFRILVFREGSEPMFAQLRLFLSIVVMVSCLSVVTSAQAPLLWSLNLKALGISAASFSSAQEFADRSLHLRLTRSNQIFIDFVVYGDADRPQLRPTRNGKRLVTLVGLLIESGTGKLIRREEWISAAPPIPRIAPLSGGGFVLLREDRLERLNDSFEQILEKRVELNWKSENPTYHLTVASAGNYLGLDYYGLQSAEHFFDVRDSITLQPAESWEADSLSHIYEDLVLTGEERGLPRLKRIGEQWQPYGLSFGKLYGRPTFLTRELMAWAGVSVADVNGRCWFETDGKMILGKPECFTNNEEPIRVHASRDGQVLAVVIGRRPSGQVSTLFDIDNRSSRVVVYTQGAHRELLRIPRDNEALDYALSPDGAILVALRTQDVRAYAVPRPR